mgnify:CR=1 FL=1
MNRLIQIIIPGYRRMLDQFVISTSQHALALDSLFSSHPINTTVANPADIEGMFDLISYKKVNIEKK